MVLLPELLGVHLPPLIYVSTTTLQLVHLALDLFLLLFSTELLLAVPGQPDAGVAGVLLDLCQGHILVLWRSITLQ